MDFTAFMFLTRGKKVFRNKIMTTWIFSCILSCKLWPPAALSFHSPFWRKLKKLNCTDKLFCYRLFERWWRCVAKVVFTEYHLPFVTNDNVCVAVPYDVMPDVHWVLHYWGNSIQNHQKGIWHLYFWLSKFKEISSSSSENIRRKQNKKEKKG